MGQLTPQLPLATDCVYVHGRTKNEASQAPTLSQILIFFPSL